MIVKERNQTLKEEEKELISINKLNDEKDQSQKEVVSFVHNKDERFSLIPKNLVDQRIKYFEEQIEQYTIEEQKRQEQKTKAYKFAMDNEVRKKISNIFKKKIILADDPQQNNSIDLQEKSKRTFEKIFNGENIQKKTEVSQARYVMAQKQQEKIQQLLAEGKAEIISQQEIEKQNNNTVKNSDVMLYCLQTSLEENGVTMIKSAECSQFDSQMNLHNLVSFQSQENYAYSLTIQDSKELSYQQLAQDKVKFQQFLWDFKKQLAQSLNQPIENIKVYGIEEGSIKIIFDLILLDRKQNFNYSELEKIFPNQVELSPHPLVSTCLISLQNFSPQFNMHWDVNHKEKEERGKEDYYFPIGWEGYALNVDEYGDDKTWLGMNNSDNEWPVFYHGTRPGFLDAIVINKFKPGPRQAYDTRKCKRTELPIGKGIYFTNHIEVAENYCSAIRIIDKIYKTVIQIRVKPTAIRQVKKASDIVGNRGIPGWDNDYFVVNQSSDIRPYRILLKQLKEDKQV